MLLYSLRLATKRGRLLKSQSPEQFRQLVVEHFSCVVSHSEDKDLLVQLIASETLLLVLEHLEVDLLLALKLHLPLVLLRLLFLEIAHGDLFEKQGCRGYLRLAGVGVQFKQGYIGDRA